MRNPDYAPAWALLAGAYAAARNTSRDGDGRIEEMRRVREELNPKVEAAARRAIDLDPNLADGYLALGGVELNRQKLLLAEELNSKALALDPNNQDVLFSYGNHAFRCGTPEGSLGDEATIAGIGTLRSSI